MVGLAAHPPYNSQPTLRAAGAIKRGHGQAGADADQLGQAVDLLLR